MKTPLYLIYMGLFSLSSCAMQQVSSETLASTLILESDTSLIALTDYYPTMDGVDSVTSSSLNVLPGELQNQFSVISNQDTPILNTLDFWNWGEKVSVIVIKEKPASKDYPKPRMWTQSWDKHRFQVTLSTTPQQILVFWQNKRLEPKDYKLTAGSLSIQIPEEARLIKRSFIRVIAADERTTTNDVLVPLEYDAVLSDVNQLARTDKQALVLYSLMIDRFYNGDKQNDKPLNQSDVLPTVDFQGGDLKGVTDKIKAGFFTEMGINTLWITPIAKNPNDAWGLDKDPYTKFSSYHGYWPVNPTVLDSRFGTEAQLREMLTEAHKRNLNVIVDYVANHLHQTSPILKEHPDWCTSMETADGRPNIRLFDEERLTTWFDTFLPTLNLEKEEVRKAMVDSALYWVKNYDFDGFRHDAAKHIPESYWRLLTKEMRHQIKDRDLYQIGETYGSAALIRSYVKSGMLDGQFDFNIYHKAVQAFGVGQEDMKALNEELYKSLDSYGYHNLMGYISGNHDKPRFISVAGGTVSLSEDTKAAGRKRRITVGDSVAYDKLALLEAFMMAIPGVPCIYQGDEYGVPGANDPDNRRMMQFDNYAPKEQQQLNTVKRLIHLRRTHLPLIYGDMLPLYCDAETLAFARIYMGEVVIAAYNRSGEAKEMMLELPPTLTIEQLSSNFSSELRINKNRVHLTVKPYGFDLLTKKL